MLAQRTNSKDSNDIILKLHLEKATPEHLAWVLSKLELGDLNTMLTNPANGVLEYFVKAVQEGDPEDLGYGLYKLADVITKLDPADLNRLLTSHGEVLDSLKKALEI
jgi:hypothetical protein